MCNSLNLFSSSNFNYLNLYPAVGAPPPLVAGATAAGASGVMAGICVTVEHITVKHVFTLPLVDSRFTVLVDTFNFILNYAHLHRLSVLTRS
jgi:hypothetical protein